MMSLAAIHQVSQDAAIRAARENRIPFAVEEQDIQNWQARLKAGTLKFPFPFLGDYLPQGWKRTERDLLFVDSTGCGREDEPALTVRATIEALTVGKAYAIVESGQFQLYLAEFARDDDSPGNEEEFVGLTSDEEAEFSEIANPKGPDVAIRFDGSICLFELKTCRARQWVIRHVVDPSYFGSALVVETRFAKDIASGMQNDRLRLV
jgi:hypothetical protein